MQIIPISINDSQSSKTFDFRLLPTLFTTIFLAISWLTNDIALAWIHERVPRDNVRPLPDLWFSVFPEVTGAIRVTEMIMLVIVINTFILMFCHQYRWIVIRRVFFCAALCYAFRAFCVTIIQVPVPSENTYCAPKSDGSINVITNRVLRTFWSAGIEQLRPRELCGDLIVSGHTISLFIATLTFCQYCPRRLSALGQCFRVAAVIAIICILLSRKHYTIDVVLGYLVATRIFWTYHSLLNSFHNGDYEHNSLNQCFWARLIPYLERDAPPPQYFINRLDWPTSCPQAIRKRCV